MDHILIVSLLWHSVSNNHPSNTPPHWCSPPSAPQRPATLIPSAPPISPLHLGSVLQRNMKERERLKGIGS